MSRDIKSKGTFLTNCGRVTSAEKHTALPGTTLKGACIREEESVPFDSWCTDPSLYAAPGAPLLPEKSQSREETRGQSYLRELRKLLTANQSTQTSPCYYHCSSVMTSNGTIYALLFLRIPSSKMKQKNSRGAAHWASVSQ